MKATNGWIRPGAMNNPAAPVNTTSETTRGFSRLSQSRASAPRVPGRARSASVGRDAMLFMSSEPHQRRRGNSSKVWWGAGDGTDHSRVVAPSPQ